MSLGDGFGGNLSSNLQASTSRVRGEKVPLLGNNSSKNNSTDAQDGVSWRVAAFLLVNTALGAGMLNYPYAYNEIGGICAATFTQVILLVFIISTMFILVYCADFNQDDTYHDVLMSMCGKRAQQISALSILLTCYGINITFLVIIGDQYDRIFNSLLAQYLDDYWILHRKFTITATAVLFILPMCYAKRLDFLRHASVLGMFAMLYVAFLTVYEHYMLDEAKIASVLSAKAVHQPNTLKSANLTQNTQIPSTEAMLKTFHWFSSMAIVPVLCFAYQTHEVIVPVYACMRRRLIGHFMKASAFGLIILFFLYNLVGTYGYLTFGAHVDPDIMSLYDAKDPVVVVGVIALVVKFITTYPPLMFCGRGALDGLYAEIRKLSPEEFKSNERTRRTIITTLWFGSTVTLAVFAPDISLTLKLLGSMAAINVFVFPGMCLVSLTRRLRLARIAILIDETSESGQQRGKDYFLLSGSYFSQLKRDAARRNASDGYRFNAISNSSTQRQPPSTTFASLIEFERYVSSQDDFCIRNEHKLNGYGSQLRYHRRQDEFEKLIANGSYAPQDSCSPFGRTVNDSFNDYSDLDARHQRTESKNKYPKRSTLGGNVSADSMSNLISEHSGIFTRTKDVVGQSSQQSQNQNERAPSQNGWIEASTTGSVFERLGASMAPTTVGQVGISKLVAFGLYLFAAILIIFGAFIFVLELVTVVGLV